jgi:centromere protein C
MAPRPTGSRRNASQSDHIYELGVQGRKTGATLRDTGVRDENGFQPIEDMFSSPEKESPVKATMNGHGAATTPGRDSDEESDDSSGQDMDIENSTFYDSVSIPCFVPSQLTLPPQQRPPIQPA